MIRYRLDDLGWFQFEWLCQSLLKVSLGVGIEAWGGHSDLGRDAYWQDTLPLDGPGSNTAGPFVFQAKFVAEANAAGSKPEEAIRVAAKQEAKRIKERLASGSVSSPSVYVLLTNAPLSATLRTGLSEILSEALPQCRVKTWGADDICALLDNAPNIRVAFPQLLGLRDLNDLLRSVVDRALIERSSLAIEQAVELASVFVPTTAYTQALQTLSSHSFVVLTGPPEMGKTAIARMIGLAKLGQGWECYECQHPEDVLKARSGDQSRLFIADDAFGTTEYRPEIAHAWASDMDRILRVVNEKRWLIWTSRPAPLHAALQRMHLQGKAEKFPQPAEVLVDAESLFSSEKALILYRHAKGANLEDQAKSLVRRFAQLVIENAHFTPERVRRFISDALPKLKIQQANEETVRKAIIAEIEHPTTSMKKSFDALSSAHKRLLVAMLDAGRGGALGKNLVAAHDRISGSGEDVGSLVNDLSSHFLRVTSRGNCPTCGSLTDDTFIDWMHPSWRDLLIEHLASAAKPRQEFLAKCGIEGFSLAVSSAGGATGQRQAPLIRTDEDLHAAATAAFRLITTTERFEVWRILTSVLEFVRRLKSEESPAPGAPTSALPDFITKVLAACRKRWEENEGVSHASDVRAYYAMSEYVSPLPPGPNLLKPWDKSRSAAFDEIEGFDEGEFEPSIGKVTGWLSLAAVIGDNEPRFLRQMGFPEKFTKTIEEFLPALVRRAQGEQELQDDDACDAENSNLDSIEELADLCGSLFPTLDGAVSELTAAISDGEFYVKRMRQRIKEKELEKESEREEEEWRAREEYRAWEESHARGDVPPTRLKGSEPPTRISSSSSPAIGPVDVAKLFEDL
jgi:hypothetical protein